MKFYKIRHIPSGLFFRPNAGYYGTPFQEGNLSKKYGKTYGRKPSWNYVNSAIAKEHGRFRKEDFEIVEFEVVETDRIPF